MVQFDHIEVHVSDSKAYAEFLLRLFQNGRFKKIAQDDIYMFLSPDNLHIEIKQKDVDINRNKVISDIGFCMPCLRMKNALTHLKSLSEVEIIDKLENDDGPCYFFKDPEGIIWHIKDYSIQDKYINI